MFKKKKEEDEKRIVEEILEGIIEEIEKMTKQFIMKGVDNNDAKSKSMYYH